VPRRAALTVVSFFQKGFSAVGSFVSRTVASIAELKRLESENAELLARVEALSIMERDYAELRGENERLREQLGFSRELAFRSLAARIVARDPGNLYSTFVVDRGAAHGVRKNQAVIAYQDGMEGLVGRVLEVGRSTCIVVPIYDSSANVAVRLERSRYEGLAQGAGTDDEGLLVKYVKKRAKDEIRYGDLVVTSGLRSLYPPGIAVGRVTRVRSLDYLTSLEVEIAAVLDFGRLEHVFIALDAGAQAGTEAP